MTAHNTTLKAPSKAYATGYGKPPKSGQYLPGQSGNPHGKPKGQPSLDQILLEEAARLVKIKTGDEVTHVSKERAILRSLMDAAARGNVAAARVYVALRYRAQIALGVAPEAEQPLTAEELETLKLLGKITGEQL
jgi:hypothetical protein